MNFVTASVLDPVQQSDKPAGVSPLAHIKRFAERYRGDAAFRALLSDDVSLPEVLASHQLEIAAQDARSFLSLERGEQVAPTSNIESYKQFVLDTAKTDRISHLASLSTNANYAEWRRRQLGALRFHFSAGSDAVVRPVAAYELSRGCSVGCWFCAVGAEKLQGHFTASPENLALFDATLCAMRELFGDAAGSAMCYWATDALDNPDYEIFAAHFAEANSVFPPTTTAIGWKNPERTLNLLTTASAHGTLLNRFSILSVGMLNRIHAAFSAEDLLTTDLVFQMQDALVSIGPTESLPAKKIRAGRARTAGRAEESLYSEDAGTVACVIGFLFNFVDRTIRLIAPCIPGDENPLGYRVFGSVEGFDHTTVEASLRSLIDQHMRVGFDDTPLRLSCSLSADVVTDTLIVRSQKHGVAFPAAGASEHALQHLLKLLRQGTHSASQLVAAMRVRGMNVFLTNFLLHRLREEGVFEIL